MRHQTNIAIRMQLCTALIQLVNQGLLESQICLGSHDAHRILINEKWWRREWHSHDVPGLGAIHSGNDLGRCERLLLSWEVLDLGVPTLFHAHHQFVSFA